MNSAVNKTIASKDKSPVYLRTRDKLVSQIQQGDFKPHDALPSERALAEQMGISRMTARQALAEVEKAGYAYRQDRKGWFVANQRLSYDVGNTLSFAARAIDESMDVSIDVISMDSHPADERLANSLGIEAGSLVHTYQRVFNVDQRPVIVETESVIAALFPDLLQQDLSQSSTLLHENRYGVFGSTGQVTIRCAPISPRDQILLGDTAPPYGMEIKLVVSDAKGIPFCCGQQIWCGDLAEFTLTAKASMPIS
ncbi:MAG: GntR family transcriptional regulator [Saprospiraceae bacterium]|jgi:GntR family transcriptional regulator